MGAVSDAGEKLSWHEHWRKFASEGFRPPSKEWARKILADPKSTLLQIKFATEALQGRKRVTREPGDDDEPIPA